MQKYTQNKVVIVLAIVLLAAILTGSAPLFSRSTNAIVDKCRTHFATYSVIKKNLDGQTFRLLVADVEAKHSYGLMNIKSKEDICNNDGMIFIFDNLGIQTFWNQNTLVDLNLYWMVGDNVLRKDKLLNITKNGMKIYSSIIPVNTVVEIINK